MASFAQVDNGVVVQTMELADEETPNEATGAAFIADLFGGEWVKMGGKRNHASIGYTWDGKKFMPPIELSPDQSTEPQPVEPAP